MNDTVSQEASPVKVKISTLTTAESFAVRDWIMARRAENNGALSALPADIAEECEAEVGFHVTPRNLAHIARALRIPLGPQPVAAPDIAARIEALEADVGALEARVNALETAAVAPPPTTGIDPVRLGPRRDID